MVSQAMQLRITAHATPHNSDPSDAHEFYAMLGMLTVAWGRLEGHIIGAFVKTCVQDSGRPTTAQGSPDRLYAKYAR
jgi:hypothetical protein